MVVETCELVEVLFTGSVDVLPDEHAEANSPRTMNDANKGAWRVPPVINDVYQLEILWYPPGSKSD